VFVREFCRSVLADFVKVYTRLSREALRAIADESRRQGLAFVGHCPDMVPLTEAVNAQQKAATHHTRGKIVLKIADEPKS